MRGAFNSAKVVKDKRIHSAKVAFAKIRMAQKLHFRLTSVLVLTPRAFVRHARKPGAHDEVLTLQPAEGFHDIARGFHARRKQLADA